MQVGLGLFFCIYMPFCPEWLVSLFFYGSIRVISCTILVPCI